MNHSELKDRLLTLPGFDKRLLRYAFAWVTHGRPSPTLIALLPQRDGTVTATRGDLRTKAEPVRTPTGDPRVFANEADACAWAWEELREGLRPPRAYSADEQAAAQASGDAVRARLRAIQESATRQDES